MGKTPQRSQAIPWAYKFIRAGLFIVYKVLFSIRFYGAERVPSDTDKRGVILAPNHASYLDPPTVGIAAKRHVTYLAKEYLFRAFIVGWVLRAVGALPIKTRAEDFKSLRDLIRILKQGRCVVVFPEGTRSADGQFQAVEGGAGFLAVKSQAWVVPIYIQGSFEAFPRQAKWMRCRPIRVYYGEPFIPALDENLMKQSDPYLAVSRKIMDEIKRLKQDVEKKS